MTQHRFFAACLGTAIALLGTPAGAQTPPATATQVSPAAYVVSGWRVECATAGSALACQALDQVTARANNGVIASVSITLAPDGKTPYVLVTTPLGVAVDSSIRMTMPSGPNQTLAFLTCNGNGCFGRAALSDSMLTAMRSTNQTLTITYDSLNGNLVKQSISITLALDGFPAAYNKLH